MKKAKFPNFLRTHPETKAWITLGLKPRVALALCRAGYRSPSEVAGLTREALLSIWSVGKRSLMRIERKLGKRLPSRTLTWRERGLGHYAVRWLARAGIETPEQLLGIDKETLLNMEGGGIRVLRQIEAGLGIRLKEKFPCWMEMGLTQRTVSILCSEGIRTVEQLQALSFTDLKRLKVHQVQAERILELTRRAQNT